MSERVFQTGHGRVFLQVSGANPNSSMVYQGMARLGSFAKAEGEVSRVQIPSRLAYDRFEDIDVVSGESSLPTTSMIARFGLTNPILSAVCPMHIQAHYGKCGNPQDQNGGWEKILAYEKARFTNRSGDEQTALDEAGRATILLTGDITARMLWEIDQMALAETCAAQIDKEVVDVTIDDYISCGECGYESEGENRIFAVTVGYTTGSPGLPAELIVSLDGGLTCEQYDIDTLAADEDPSAVALVGGVNVVVPSADSLSLHYVDLDDLDTWQEVAAGFIAGGGPNDIHSHSSTQSWLVGNSGIIYSMANPADGVTVIHNAVLTAQNLIAVHGSDSRNIVAVGAAGVILFSSNGGATWAAITSPTVQIINTIWMRTRFYWMIGDAGGRMYFTTDGGVTWTEKVFGLSGQGEVHGIAFSHHPDSPFGFMTATDGAMGYVFRSLDGGSTWYQLPDTAAATPANIHLNAIDAGISGNFCVAGGLRAGTDGILMIGS
ncbi:hypothetical protein LCGC14_0275250 [marine sediment metagenome]|uniref:Photosynthesis system II assembly factor Ycf48/Hcf136-like domain-containing protein n=1 Tax=marine sediment metagenome TaxID=412755 RepID=A0A0F9TXF4_9ZZZZ